MGMDDRKRWVLKAITDYYIKTGEPISSKTLLEDYPMGVSSATIRNDMKALEEEGLITKAYSSAGRVPTERGFRFFVDWLVELGELAQEKQHAIMESYRFQRQDVEKLLQQTAFLLANLSDYAGFVLSPRLEDARLESIVFINLDPGNALVVIISELGIIQYQVIPSTLSDEELHEVSTLLNETLRGRRLGEVRAEAIRFAREEGWYDPLARNAFTLLKESLERRMERRLHVEGVFELFEHLLDEGHDVKEARALITLLRDGRELGRHLERHALSRIQARIGSENELPELRKCCLVFTGYGFSGVVGILGPMRMDYGKAFSITSYIGNRLKAILTLSHREREVTLETEVT